MRSAAAESLGQLGKVEEAGEILLDLGRDKEMGYPVRHHAAEALEELGRSEEAGEILLGLARDEKVHARARRAAAESLVQLGQTEEAKEILLKLADVRPLPPFPYGDLIGPMRWTEFARHGVAAEYLGEFIWTTER